MNNYDSVRFLLTQRVTKLDSDEDVDGWLTTFRFKLFNFNDETYYVRYLVIDDVQCKITIYCKSNDIATISVVNCENNLSYEEVVKFKPVIKFEDKSRIETICDAIMNGVKNIGLEVNDLKSYLNRIQE